jgi:hypothetical protein
MGSKSNASYEELPFFTTDGTETGQLDHDKAPEREFFYRMRCCSILKVPVLPGGHLPP